MKTIPTTPHPTFPLQQEQRDDIETVLIQGGSMMDVFSICARYDKYRDLEFPQWRAHYNTAFAEWLKGQG